MEQTWGCAAHVHRVLVTMGCMHSPSWHALTSMQRTPTPTTATTFTSSQLSALAGLISNWSSTANASSQSTPNNASSGGGTTGAEAEVERARTRLGQRMGQLAQELLQGRDSMQRMFRNYWCGKAP